MLIGKPTMQTFQSSESRRARLAVVLALGVLLLGPDLPTCPHAAALAQQATGDANDDANDQQQSPEDPFAGSPLLKPPDTPEKTFDAVVLMLDLANVRLARAYLEMLMKQNPTDEQLLRMRAKHGVATFLRLANTEALQPLSIRLLERMNAAFRKQAVDPARIDRLIQQLSGSAQRREIAVFQLRELGPVAMPRLLQRLGRPRTMDEHDRLVYVLTRMGRQIIGALRAALDSDDPGLRSAVIEVIGRLGDQEDAPYLLFPAFAPSEPQSVRLQAQEALATILYGSPRHISRLTAFGVEAQLLQTARRLWRDAATLPADPGRLPDFWIWDPQQQTVRLIQIDPAEAMLFEAHRFARQALLLNPESLPAQATFTAISLARDARTVDWDQPLPTGPGTAADAALSAGPDVVAAAVRTALLHQDNRAALAGLQVLAPMASPNILRSADKQKSTVLAALNFPDPRVQFAAARIAVQLEPTRPFRGASRVILVLAQALHDAGRPHALIIDPNPARAATVGGIIREVGFDPVIAATGQDGFRVATERGDIELIAVHVNVVRWPLSMTLANLRADARTGLTPIVVYGPNELRPRIERLAERYRLVRFIIESRDSGNVKLQLDPFLRSLRTPPLSPDEHKRRARQAAELLATAAALQRPEVFDLTPALPALVVRATDEELGFDALYALGSIAARNAQRRLLEVVTGKPLPVPLRAFAARQLAYSIQRFGLLLDSPDIAALRATAAGTADRDFRTAMSILLGTLQPETRLSGRRLLELPVRPPQPPQ
ncbi:MAG: HEAT repeat domain-containing protein [Planctomycetota bacterium]|nr:MAG: HEAT repeat domain-containing protein [Planctomycetota bacterium]